MVQGSPPGEPPGERDLSLLSAYLDDELSDAERAQLEARLDADAALQAELEALFRTIALIRSLPQVPVPRNFTLDPAQYGRRQTGGWWLNLATPMLAAGASLLLVAVGVSVLLTGGGLSRQAAPLLAPAAGEGQSVADAEFVAEEAAAPAEEPPMAFEMVEEEEAEEEEAPASEAVAAEDRVEGAEAGGDVVGESEAEMAAAASEPLPEEPVAEEAVAQEAPAEEEGPVDEAEADAAARLLTGTPEPLATASLPAGAAEAPEIAELPDAGAADEAAASAAEPAAKKDDGEVLVEGAPGGVAPLRSLRAIPLMIGAVAVVGIALLVAGFVLTLAKRRR